MKRPRPIRHIQRGNPFLTERIHDPYRARKKLPEGTRCPECGARFRNGRWIWPQAQTYALKSEPCPACRRIADHYPAGEIVLSGSFLNSHRDEILARAYHVEEAERTGHPLHRIMSVEERDNDIVISTTDIHLPHRIGHALRDAWGGMTKSHYDVGGYFTRVTWQRNE